MGKLSKIRKAVEKNPKAWIKRGRGKGARFDGSTPKPIDFHWWDYRTPYGKYVEKVLSDLGYLIS